MGIILNILIAVINIAELVIVIEVLLSWVIQDRNNQIMNFLRTFTNPILDPLRNVQNRYLGDLPVDISPFMAVFVLYFIRKLIFMIF